MSKYTHIFTHTFCTYLGKNKPSKDSHDMKSSKITLFYGLILSPCIYYHSTFIPLIPTEMTSHYLDREIMHKVTSLYLCLSSVYCCYLSLSSTNSNTTFPLTKAGDYLEGATSSLVPVSVKQNSRNNGIISCNPS